MFDEPVKFQLALASSMKDEQAAFVATLFRTGDGRIHRPEQSSPYHPVAWGRGEKDARLPTRSISKTILFIQILRSVSAPIKIL